MIRLSIGNSRMEKHWNLVEMELSEFRDRISHTRRTAETVEQYRKLGKAKQDEIKDVGGFVLGTLKVAEGGRIVSLPGRACRWIWTMRQKILSIRSRCSFPSSAMYTPPISTPRKSRGSVLSSLCPVR